MVGLTQNTFFLVAMLCVAIYLQCPNAEHWDKECENE